MEKKQGNRHKQTMIMNRIPHVNESLVFQKMGLTSGGIRSLDKSVVRGTFHLGEADGDHHQSHVSKGARDCVAFGGSCRIWETGDDPILRNIVAVIWSASIASKIPKYPA